MSVKFIRIFLIVLSIAVASAAVILFFETERKYLALNEAEPRAQAVYSNWLKQNYCDENSEPCTAYSEQFNEWLLQMEQYRQRKMQSPEFQCYFFLKELDEFHVPDLNSGGLASLVAVCAAFLLITLLIVYLLGGRQRLKAKPAFKPKQTESIPEQAKPTIEERLHSAPASRQGSLALLKKAAECADSEPVQAISYLEQAIEGSLDTKLSDLALLLCGSLRLKSKMGEEQGREQLQKIISASPQSSEAKKAQMALDAFK